MILNKGLLTGVFGRFQEADPYWGSVMALFHFDGNHDSTLFIEQTGKTATAYGDAKLSTTYSVFGGTSLYMPGAGGYITLPGSSDWAFGTGDFTIECRMRTPVATTRGHLLSNRTASTNTQWELYTYAGKLMFGGGTTDYMETATTLLDDTWYVIAVSRIGTSLKMFLDGAVVGSVTNSNNFSDSTTPFCIGCQPNGYYNLNGFIDEVRVTKGVGRYSGAYTVATTPFPDQ